MQTASGEYGGAQDHRGHDANLPCSPQLWVGACHDGHNEREVRFATCRSAR